MTAFLMGECMRIFKGELYGKYTNRKSCDRQGFLSERK